MGKEVKSEFTKREGLMRGNRIRRERNPVRKTVCNGERLTSSGWKERIVLDHTVN